MGVFPKKKLIILPVVTKEALDSPRGDGGVKSEGHFHNLELQVNCLGEEGERLRLSGLKPLFPW